MDLAGTWIDQPYVSKLAPGWAITLSVEPTFEIVGRCGLATSTRNNIRKIWPYHLPSMDPETLAKLVFCFENDPERADGFISGAQDAIGICMPGLTRHYYDNRFWPSKIESCLDEKVLGWLEDHLCLVPMFPRREGCSVVDGMQITAEGVHALTSAADRCWTAILSQDFEGFAGAFAASFRAQVAMFPAMMQPGVQDYIDRYAACPDVRAWKMTGAGGGGYLLLAVSDASAFLASHPEAIRVVARRPGM